MVRMTRWRIVLPIILAITALLATLTLTSRAANTIEWQPASSGLPTSGLVRDVAFGDVNHDGKPDVVIAYANNQGLAVFAGNGAGQWSSSGMTAGLPSGGDYKYVAVGDLNNDGKPDIVATGASDNGVKVWYGDGAGSWTGFTAGLPASGFYGGVALGDVNRDGRLDVLAGGSGGAATGVKVYLNFVTAFSETTSVTATGAYNQIAAGYVDGDGYLDLVAGNNGGGVYFWKGAANNAWTPASTGLTTTVGFRGVAFGDINRDGKLDILASRTGFAGPNGGGLFAYLWNEATNSWSLAPNQIPVTGSYGEIDLRDVNNDGWLDIMAGGFPSQGTPGVYSWLGGATGFATGPPVTTTGDLPAIAVADFDRDGLLDVAAGHNQGAGVRAWRNSGVRDSLGAWTVGASPLITSVPKALATGDLNRDGYLDLVVSRPEGGLNAWKGNGGNNWTDCGLSSLGTADTGVYESAIVGLYTGHSRYPDVIGARGDGGGIRHFDNGWGTCYWGTTVITASGSFRGLSGGDIDGDGNPDLVAARLNNGLRVWEKGTAGWGLTGSPTTTGNYYDTALGDFNHDGRLDIAAAAADGTGVKVFVYAAGSWISRVVTATGEYFAIAVGDLNNDGHLDVVAAKNGIASEQGIHVWLGNSAGTVWTPWGSPSLAGQYYDLDLADFNYDGKLDILAARDGLGVGLWTGDGVGNWTTSSTNLPTASSFFNASFGHVDRDGNLDLLATQSDGGLRIWTAKEATPPTIGNIQPTGWVTTSSPSVYASAIDTGTGISVTSALYRFSTNGGGSWSAYFPASASGSNGVTSTIAITAANVPFNQDSAAQNVIEFKIADVAGNVSTAQAIVKIDATPPTPPTSLTSDDDTTYVWSNDNTIAVSWSGATDGTSGVSGYSVLFDLSPNTLPDETVDVFPSSYTSPPVADGDWYVHVRSRDLAGNWSATAKHLGPFFLDTTKPTNPTDFGGATAGEWTSDNEVHVTWWGETDTGSLAMGYSYEWTPVPDSVPDTTMDTVQDEVTSQPLPDGSWYFHVRVRDFAGNWADGAAHRGPYKIDRTPPSSSVTGPSGYVDKTYFTVNWSGSDSGSGV